MSSIFGNETSSLNIEEEITLDSGNYVNNAQSVSESIIILDNQLYHPPTLNLPQTEHNECLDFLAEYVGNVANNITPEEIKIKYELNPDTNAYTDSEKALTATIPNKIEIDVNNLTNYQTTTTVNGLLSQKVSLSQLEDYTTTLDQQTIDQLQDDAINSKYNASNPSGFITNAELTPYTETVNLKSDIIQNESVQLVPGQLTFSQVFVDQLSPMVGFSNNSNVGNLSFSYSNPTGLQNYGVGEQFNKSISFVNGANEIVWIVIHFDGILVSRRTNYNDTSIVWNNLQTGNSFTNVFYIPDNGAVYISSFNTVWRYEETINLLFPVDHTFTIPVLDIKFYNPTGEYVVITEFQILTFVNSGFNNLWNSFTSPTSIKNIEFTEFAMIYLTATQAFINPNNDLVNFTEIIGAFPSISQPYVYSIKTDSYRVWLYNDRIVVNDDQTYTDSFTNFLLPTANGESKWNIIRKANDNIKLVSDVNIYVSGIASLNLSTPVYSNASLNPSMIFRNFTQTSSLQTVPYIPINNIQTYNVEESIIALNDYIDTKISLQQFNNTLVSYETIVDNNAKLADKYDVSNPSNYIDKTVSDLDNYDTTTTVNTKLLGYTRLETMMISTLAGSPANGTSIVWGSSWNTNLKFYLCAKNMIIDTLFIICRQSAGAGSATYTLFKNGVATTLLSTFTTNALQQIVNIPISFSAGDTYHITHNRAGITHTDIQVGVLIRY